jgi:mRNA interferase HigB
MRVHLIKRQAIDQFVEQHASGRRSFEIWISTISYVDWITPSDIKKTFCSADLLGRGSDRVVFNIGGNNYRIISKYFFGENRVHLYIKWIGTHAEYNELCKKLDQYRIDQY